MDSYLKNLIPSASQHSVGWEDAPFLARLTGVYTPTAGTQTGINLYSFVEQSFDPTTGIPFDLPAGRQTYPPPPYNPQVDYVPTSAYAIEDNNDLLTVPGTIPAGFLNAGPYVEMRLKGVVEGVPVYEFLYAQPLAYVGLPGYGPAETPFGAYPEPATITLASSGTTTQAYSGNQYFYLRGSIASAGLPCYLLMENGICPPLRPVLAKLLDYALPYYIPVYYYSDPNTLFPFGPGISELTVTQGVTDASGWMSSVTLDVEGNGGPEAGQSLSGYWVADGPSVKLFSSGLAPPAVDGLFQIDLTGIYGGIMPAVQALGVPSTVDPTAALLLSGSTQIPGLGDGGATAPAYAVTYNNLVSVGGYWTIYTVGQNNSLLQLSFNGGLLTAVSSIPGAGGGQAYQPPTGAGTIDGGTWA